MTINEIIAGRSVKTIKHVNCDFYEDARHIADLLIAAGAEDVTVCNIAGAYTVRFTESTN